ncbi:epoxide hydrolase [Amycolatopsis sp. QT-25]|uniref:epoxide hydrolase family protein n=1 Tax=Amycolatopsis sp. QT-25 TaxID=3034022 RepID=UPI0023EC29DE|nr:epoxide hydrolase family protein [Amycolatopsis sp. QT-25]WET83068.1 epoxide hydrolase [Amycolatopsis sp. QT-25]
MKPFRIDIPQRELDELKQRLAQTRWPDAGPEPGWARGIPLDYLKDLTRYWLEDYNWRAAEERLNFFPQFTTEIDGENIHFLHVRSPEPDAVPLILTHGWPGSFVEFLEMIEPLTDPRKHGGDPADAFHVVVPSLPGFTFSGPTKDTGWDIPRIADAWAELMRRLGYDRYVAQGSDYGMLTSLQLALAAPDHVSGVHINMLVAFPPQDDPAAMTGLDEDEQARLAHATRFALDGFGFQKIQSSRPQTLAYALTDSPVGQLAWIAEKFKEWADAPDVPEDAVARDHLLTNVTLYWLTATAGSSAQIYYESGRLPDQFNQTWGGPWPVTMPVGMAFFPKDVSRPIRRWAEKTIPTLTHWTEFSGGGHFAAMERPDDLVRDIRTFVARNVRHR